MAAPNSYAGRRQRDLEAVLPVSDGDDMLIVSCRLKSGRFESELQIPLASTDDEKKDFIDSWLALMATGIRCGQTAREKRDANSTPPTRKERE